MKITELMLQETMVMDLQARSKEGAIDELIASLVRHGRINDPVLFKEKILKREAESSTGIGGGIAMPHAKTAAVNEATVVFAKSAKGIDFEALDGEPVNLFFMIAVPEGAGNIHLRTLAALSKLLIDSDFIKRLQQAQTPAEVSALFDAKQREAEAEEQAEAQKAEQGTRQEARKENRPAARQGSDNGGAGRPDEEAFVVAVTACPTGIAHTYMAEDALKKMAKEMGVAIRVETNGSEGARNKLTEDEIRRAKAVIIAADRKVEMTRFDGKPLLQKSVTDGIRKPKELIEQALRGEAPIYHTDDGKDGPEADDRESKESIGGKIYKDLMNGISHMLPFVVGGGILIAISFLFEQLGGAENPLYKLLMTIGGDGAFHFLIPILAGFIAMSIGDRPALMPGMVGGLMAVNSNAGFLGGLAAGFMAGYVVIGLRKAFAGLPKSLEGLKPILLYPVVGLLIAGAIMYYIFDPIFSTINVWLVSGLNNLGTVNAVLLGLVLGGMMSIDMGGPFNKAAYTFAIGVFTTSGNTNGTMMAAVMAGGMVPPLAIALASTLFFKRKFTEQERRSGLTNYILGLSFITEGAIPFAAADPLRVLTSCIIGSAVAGGLTQLWNINIPAPHGGIFVAALANHALLFLLSVAIGSVLSALILGVWKRTLHQQ